MMTLGCLMRADEVRGLLDKAAGSHPYPNPAISAGQAHAIINAALWLHGVRDDSTSAAYAWNALDQAVHSIDWFDWRRQRIELGLNPSVEYRPSAGDSYGMRIALGLRHDLWAEAAPNEHQPTETN